MTTTINKTHTQYETGILDPWGRAIGATFTTWEGELNEWGGPADPAAPDRHPIAYRFMLEIQNTRDGVRYQASRRSAFRTAEARGEHVAKYLKAAKRKAAKVAERGTLSQRRAR